MSAENESDDASFTIGQQMANAVAHEQSHRAEWSGAVSPLAAVRYDWSGGEGDLLRLRPAPADGPIERFLEHAADGGGELTELRGALTIDDFYTLLTFTRRSIVRTLRGGSPNLIDRALAGLVLVDPERLDPRDLSWAMALSSWAVRRLGLSRDAVLRDARRVGPPAAIEALGRFLDEEVDLSDWGFIEVSGPAGLGLAERGYAKYEPTTDLLDAALRIADAVEGDRYEPTTVSLANDLPEVWFRGKDAERLRDLLSGVRATIAIHSTPRPDADENASSQMLLVLVSECANSSDAKWLASAARNSAGTSHHSVAVQHGRLLVTLIARSFVMGTPSMETAESIGRFVPALSNALSSAPIPD